MSATIQAAPFVNFFGGSNKARVPRVLMGRVAHHFGARKIDQPPVGIAKYHEPGVAHEHPMCFLGGARHRFSTTRVKHLCKVKLINVPGRLHDVPLGALLTPFPTIVGAERMEYIPLKMFFCPLPRL